VVIVVSSTAEEVRHTAERVRDVLRDSDLRAEADDVADYLRHRARRGDVIESMAGQPGLLDTELRSQAFAGHFHREIFESVSMLSARGVAELLGPVTDVRGFARRLRANEGVVALRHKNTYVYPLFQFDERARALKPVVSEVNRLLGAAEDPWGAMAWWTSEHPRSGHRRPIEDPDDPRLVALVEADIDADGF
jgi:hypothetical protein